MSKTCPECGKIAADDAKFCIDCGHRFNNNPTLSSNIFSNGKIFLIIIALILIFGALFIITLGDNGNDSTDGGDEIEHVDLTIADVLGYDGHYGNKTSYTVYTSALFLEVPSDLKGYVIKTSYCDENDTVLGQETETLSNVYYDTDYDISFGHYTSHIRN